MILNGLYFLVHSKDIKERYLIHFKIYSFGGVMISWLKQLSAYPPTQTPLSPLLPHPPLFEEMGLESWNQWLTLLKLKEEGRIFF